jgi:cystathionine gamma-synthase
LASAEECFEYCTSPQRIDGARNPAPPDAIQVRAFKAKDRFWAVIFPSEYVPVATGFWSKPGVGVSSRFAEANLSFTNQLTEMSIFNESDSRPSFETAKHETLRERIVSYLKRATLQPTVQKPSSNDVYLFPTGMASIYKSHTYLNSLYNGTTILFGMAFMDTVAAFQEFGSGFKFFGLGSDEDLLALEVFLREECDQGRKVQAIWAEFPANPILVTPDLTRLRALADEYDAILAIDDTIGSYANIDITHMTDILVTSLTKSFNGYADVIAGCAILNPASRHYDTLKALFDTRYIPELYVDDVEALERNSRDYLTRTTKLNHNAKALVDYLQTYAEDSNSAVNRVHYPSVNTSGKHYRQFMRPETPDFTPGYGCLFSVELEDIETTEAFYNNLNVHNSVHLGAPFTLAFAYTACTYAKKLDWAASYGLKPTQIRVTAGLENTDLLLEDFKIAVEAANQVKSRLDHEM